jgi:hypothetical protein
LNWVTETTRYEPIDIPIKERVYIALNGNDAENPSCPEGRRRPFYKMSDPYPRCIRGCPCVSRQRSESAREMNARFTPEQKRATIAKREATFFELHGVKNPAQLASVQEKIEATSIENWGTRRPTMNRTVVERAISTSKINHGGIHHTRTREIRDKIEKTNIEKYNSPHTMHIARDFFAEQNDGLNPFQIEEYKEKIISTMLKNHGVAHALQSPEIQEKMGDRTFAKRGVRNVMQDADVVKKQLTNNNLKYNRNSPNQIHYTDENYATMLSCSKFTDLFQGRSLREVADHLGMGYDTARKYCVKYGVVLGKSSYETAIADFIKNLNFEIEQGNRKIIAPLEIDILISSCNLGIEFCGLYWHSDAHKNDKNYHLKKLKASNEAGLRLITIFEDEWLKKRNIVESRLRSALGISPRGVGGRKLRIEKISGMLARNFYDIHHIQGSANGSFHYGAFDKDVLVAAMSFSKMRPIIGGKIENGHYELLRFATDGKSYAGVASKLFQTFCKSESPLVVTSYADRRWSHDGGVYKTLGFAKIKETDAGYWYFHGNRIVRETRHKYKKHLIRDMVPDGNLKSEKEIMRELGYYRIWDCGHFKFEWRGGGN